MAPAGRTGWTVAGIGAAAIAGLTLYPAPEDALAALETPLYCLVCGERGGADVLLNLLLTVPLGFGVRLATGSGRYAVAAAAILSLTVELLQLTVIPGRDASLSDVLSNSIGGGLGAWLAARARRFLRPAPAQAWVLLLAGGAGLVGLLTVSSWLQAPVVAAPGTPTVLLRGHRFLGRLTRVVIDAAPAPITPVTPLTEAQRRGMRAGRIGVDVDVLTGRFTRERRAIFALGSAPPRLVLSHQGRSAVLEAPARAVVFRLRPPTVMLRRAFPSDSGVAVTLRADTRDRTLRLESAYGAERRGIAVATSPTHGWVLVAPFGLSLGYETRLVTGALLFAALFVLGYWGGAARRAAALAVLAGVIGGGLGILPALGGFPAVHWSEWGAALGGTAVGWAAGRRAAYLQARCGSPSATVSSSS